MVFRGKLSKGCAECRVRKTRCDAARPSCGQCRRLGRQCSGYRNLDELRLLDQTADVTMKLVKASNSTTAGMRSYRMVSSPSSTNSTSSGTSSDTFSTFPPPTFWVEYGARALFFEQYVDVFVDYKKTDLSYVTPAYSDAKADGMLSEIVAALGLVALSRRDPNPSTELFATQKYASALKQASTALRCPTKATSHEMLATVLLLALHESIVLDTAPGQSSGPSVHLLAAIRILQLRGSSGLASKLPDPRIFHTICSQAILSCMYARKEIPAALLDFERRVQNELNPEEVSGCELVELAARLCRLLALPLQRDATEDSRIYRRLISIDQELAAWPSTLSWRFDYSRVAGQKSSLAFFDHHDVYLNHVAASAMNRFRCVRIAVNEELLRIVHASSARTLSELMEAGEDLVLQRHLSEAIIAQMSEDVVHSVPFFLGQGSQHKLVKGGFGEVEGEEVRVTMFGGVAMMMPLHYAANRTCIAPDMYAWLVGLMSRVCQVTGIAQAKALLEERLACEEVY